MSTCTVIQFLICCEFNLCFKFYPGQFIIVMEFPMETLFHDRTSLSNDQDIERNLCSSPSTSCHTRFWRKAIAIVMMPFLAVGIPVIPILFDTNRPLHFTLSNLTKEILSTRVINTINVINAICLVIALGVNLWFIYLLCALFYYPFIIGQINESFKWTIREFIETFPVALLINLMWLRGARLGQIVKAMDGTLWRPGQIEVKRNITILAVSVFSCFLINLLPYLSIKWKLDTNKKVLTTHEDYSAHMPYGIINSMIFPLYIVFCAVSDIDLII